MAGDYEGCDTCARLEASEVVVTVAETEDPAERRFVGHPWAFAGTLVLADAAAAGRHPLGRALWRAGCVEVRLDDQGATVRLADPRAWPFHADGMALTLKEQLTLTGGASGR